MNKKILLPLLILGLGLSACTPAKPGSESQPDDSTTTESEVETPIWEEELVDGETAISELINGTDGDYHMVRGTVVGRSGSTMALARGDDFIYCYNFNSSKNENIEAYETGNYVEVYAQISHYEGSVQMTAYVDGQNDLNAYVQVLEADGETIAPTVLNADNFSTVHVNTNAGLLVQAEGLVNVSGAFTATGTSSNEDAKFKLGENDVTVRLEKFYDSATRADFVATLDALEATATYTIVALMTASSGGGRLMLVDSSTVTKTAEATEEVDPLPTEPQEVTIAEALAAVDGYPVIVTGTVTTITEAWSSYNNMSFNISDGKDEILIFRVKTQVETGQNVTVTGKMDTYNGVREVVNGTLVINDTGAEEPEEPEQPTDGVNLVGTISSAIPEGWTYITNNPSYPNPSFYSNGGLKVNFENMGIESPKFEAQSSLDVTMNVLSLNANTKTGSAKDVFTVTGYNEAGEEVATAGVATVGAAGDYTVTLTGTAITSVKVIMTAYAHNGTAYCNISLGCVTIVSK